ncbi:MAG: putative cytosolic protein [Deltaproteobacteria bacterium]|nr:putative cytosolic protein [Deltaproteobacteria bacterium]
MAGYRETNMCVRCEGNCCRRQSGHCLPSEFGSAEAVKTAVISGKYGIVLLLDTGIMARIVRPSYKDPYLRVGCVFHQARGCELKWEDRPYGCRLLRPRERDDEHCTPEGISLVEAGEMWELSGYLPPLSACLDNYPGLRGLIK